MIKILSVLMIYLKDIYIESFEIDCSINILIFFIFISV